MTRLVPRCSHLFPLNQGPTPCHLAGHWRVACGCGCDTDLRVCTAHLADGYRAVSACPDFPGHAAMATDLQLWRAR